MTESSLLDEFWIKLIHSSRRVLLLDYDGTLAPFRVEREQAVPYPGIREILEEILHSRTCRMVIVSGRRVDDLLGLIDLTEKPEIWGSHGNERLYPDSRYEVVKINERAKNGLALADTWLQEESLQGQGEHKPGCLALHWRGMSSERIVSIRARVSERWSQIADTAGLELHDFDGGLELRTQGRNKGDAVRRILDEENREAVFAYLGDDLTDEDAFAAIAGRGLGVLIRREERPTQASLWLRPPEQLLTFLQTWSQICVRSE